MTDREIFRKIIEEADGPFELICVFCKFLDDDGKCKKLSLEEAMKRRKKMDCEHFEFKAEYEEMRNE
jgi:hypothetical protein